MADDESLPLPAPSTAPTLLKDNTSQYLIRRTLPDEVLRHDISDEELEMLCGARKDHVWEGMWAAAGTSLGVLPSAVTSFAAYIDTKHLPLIDLVQIIILFVATAIWIVLLLIVRGKSALASNLKDQIRARTRGAKIGQ